MQNIILESLDRFIGDNDTMVKTWEELYYKIENNNELNKEDIKLINYCVQTCTFFKDFDYTKHFN